MLSKEDYHKEYLRTHPVSLENINFSNKVKKSLKLNFLFLVLRNYKTYLLLTPLIFTFALNLIVVQFKYENLVLESDNKTKNTFSKQKEEHLPTVVNNMFMKKIIDNKDLFINNYSYKSKTPSTSKNRLIKEKKVLNTDKNNIIDLELVNWKKNYSKKKIKFIETILPLIVFENRKILIERNKLIEIKNFVQVNKTLSDFDVSYLHKISKKYLISTDSKHKIDLIDELLHQVNIIPNSIVLAQAVNESGWGSSRFATEYNALFGEYTYDIKNGVIPSKRDKDKKHLIKHFSSIDKSVESYFQNINTHHAYENFRLIRSQINSINLSHHNIKLLTGALDVYAEDQFYVDIINSIIDSNNFTQFDQAKELFTKS